MITIKANKTNKEKVKMERGGMKKKRENEKKSKR
jgi:hypothetical protein